MFRLLIGFSSLFVLMGLGGQLCAQNRLLAQEKTKRTHQRVALGSVLTEIEAAYEVFFLYESDLVNDVQVPDLRIKGNRKLDHILEEILAHTHLEYAFVANRTYALVRSKKPACLYGGVSEKNQAVLAGATIRVQDGPHGTISNSQGVYQLQLTAGHQVIEVRHVGFEPQTIPVYLAAGDSIQLDVSLSVPPLLEEVVVVGSRFVASSLLKNTAPADVVKSDRLRGGGQQPVSQMLQYAAPSFHSTGQFISDGTDHVEPATLRGMSPDQMLLLINGKRRYHSALVNINGTVGKGSVATDLNTIPAIAIDRIEVLRDGATTTYGSDAIAGVINIILKEQAQFMDVVASTGITKQGDGGTVRLAGNFGWPLARKNGFVNLSLEASLLNPTNRSGRYTGQIFGDSRDENAAARAAFFSQTGYDQERVMRVGNAASRDARLMLNTEFPINKNLTGYAVGATSFRHGIAGGFYRFPYQRLRQSGRYPLGFSPKLHTHIFDRSLTTGIKVSRTPWQIDLSNTYGGNRFNFSVHNSNNASLGLVSPTQAEAGGFAYHQNLVNFDATRSFELKFPLSVGFGTEFRLESYRQYAGEWASWADGETLSPDGRPLEVGMQMFPGFRPETATRAYRFNIGAYAKLDAELQPGLRVNLAGRQEYYTDFKGYFIWKAGLAYTWKDKLTWRATYNTGFRAPSMPQLYFSSRGTQFLPQGTEQVGFTVAQFNNQDPVTQSFGIKALQPETSRNYNLGWMWQALPQLSFSIDFYRIQVRDKIVLTGQFSSDDDARFAEILTPLGVSKAQFFTNAIDTRTQGLDWSVQYRHFWEKLSLRTAIHTNFNQTRVLRDADGVARIHSTPTLAGFESILFNREEVGRIEAAQPNSKLIFFAQLEAKNWQMTLASTRFGAVQYIHPQDGNPANWVWDERSNQVRSRDQVFSPKWVTDWSASLRTGSLEWTIGVHNLFDVYPDEHTHAVNRDNGNFVYSRRVQQFGVKGAYGYTTVRWRW